MKMMSQSFGSIGVFSFKLQSRSLAKYDNDGYGFSLLLFYRSALKTKKHATIEICNNKTNLVYDFVQNLRQL